MSKIIVVIILILAVVGGIYYYQYHSKLKPENGGEICIQVVTPARNPETGEIKEFPTPCDVPAGWDTLEGDGNAQYDAQGATWQRYRNSDLGLSFEYRTDPDSYTLIERGRKTTDPVNLLHTFTLMKTKEYLELMGSNAPREGPPTISISVINNPEHTPLETWVKTQTIFSLYESGKTLTRQTIGGAPAISYHADGLYQNDMIVVDNNFQIYIVSGAYNNPNDQIRADFQRFVSSLLFF